MSRTTKKRRRIQDDDPNWESEGDDILEDEIDNIEPENSFDFFELKYGDKNTQTQFKNIKEEIRRTDPNIITILNTEMLQEDKMELFQLFEVYASTDVSLERLDVRKKIITKQKEAVSRFQKYKKFSKNKKRRIQDDLEQLMDKTTEEDVKYDILELDTTTANKRAIYSRYKRMTEMSIGDDELPKIKNWLKWALHLPYDRVSNRKFEKKCLTKFLQNLYNEMNNELYGMENVKEQILVFLNSRLLNPHMQKCSLGLIGPPGVGKTAIVQLISRVLKYPLQQIKMGGANTPEFLRGHQYTYIGSEPGEIVKCLTRMKLDNDFKPVKNGILFFDEYEKVTPNISAALLDITDSTQNHDFRDTFLSSLSIDLSQLWFFYSMNSKPQDDALSDRINYINVKGYTQKDKYYIVRDYLLRKLHTHLEWPKNSVKFSDDAIHYLIQKVSPESIRGVRSLENAVISIGTKINFLIHHQNKQGKLPGFHTSFDIGEKVKFPYTLKKNKLKLFLPSINDPNN